MNLTWIDAPSDDGSTTTLTLDFSFSHTGETVEMVGTVAISDATGAGIVNITFKVNGSTFATGTGTTLTKAGGGQLTVGEQLALVSLLQAAANVSAEVPQLFAPAENILGL